MCQKYNNDNVKFESKYLQSGRVPPRLSEGYQKTNFKRKANSFLMKGDELHRRFKGQDLKVIRFENRESIWREIHTNAHCGREATWGNFRDQFWFKNAYKWVANNCNACDACKQKRNFLAPKKMAPLRPIAILPLCMGRVHLDLTGGCVDVLTKKNILTIFAKFFFHFSTICWTLNFQH